jgi:molybdopterin converting factor small subunit
MIEIQVKFYGGLHTRYPGIPLGQPLTCSVAEGTSIKQLLDQVLQLPPGTVALPVVNGRVVAQEHTLAPGDLVALFPPMAGG